MNWEAVGAIAEMLGAVGVIATLLYLSFQIKQNSKAIEAQMYQARSSESGQRFGQVADSPYLAAIYAKLRESGSPFDLDVVDELSAVDFERLRNSELRVARGVDNSHQQYVLGYLTEEFLDELRYTIRIRHQLWERLGMRIGSRSSFQEFIEQTVRDDT